MDQGLSAVLLLLALVGTASAAYCAGWSARWQQRVRDRTMQNQPARKLSPSPGGGAASSLLSEEAATPAAPLVPFKGYAFPLPTHGGTGLQDAGQERSLGWQRVKLGWSPKRLVPACGG